jgi:S-layer homology domain
MAPTQTPGGPTATAVPSNTPIPTSTPAQPTSTPTACTLTFTDVPPGSTFYPFIHCLACLSIINGYPTGTFRPNADVTRGQLSKIVSNSAGFNDSQTAQMFQDVPVGSTFFVYIGRLASRGYINGYPCGGAGEPCVPPANLPYFRPNANATRGQISKIVSNAAGFNDPPSGQQFEDVAPGSTYYEYIYRLATRNVMSGYPCSGSGEPCVPPANLPYFRPNNNATRGQTSKIVSNTFFPDCNPPAR